MCMCVFVYVCIYKWSAMPETRVEHVCTHGWGLLETYYQEKGHMLLKIVLKGKKNFLQLQRMRTTQQVWLPDLYPPCTNWLDLTVCNTTIEATQSDSIIVAWLSHSHQVSLILSHSHQFSYHPTSASATLSLTQHQPPPTRSQLWIVIRCAFFGQSIYTNYNY